MVVLAPLLTGSAEIDILGGRISTLLLATATSTEAMKVSEMENESLRQRWTNKGRAMEDKLCSEICIGQGDSGVWNLYHLNVALRLHEIFSLVNFRFNLTDIICQSVDHSGDKSSPELRLDVGRGPTGPPDTPHLQKLLHGEEGQYFFSQSIEKPANKVLSDIRFAAW